MLSILSRYSFLWGEYLCKCSCDLINALLSRSSWIFFRTLRRSYSLAYSNIEWSYFPASLKSLVLCDMSCFSDFILRMASSFLLNFSILSICKRWYKDDNFWLCYSFCYWIWSFSDCCSSRYSMYLRYFCSKSQCFRSVFSFSFSKNRTLLLTLLSYGLTQPYLFFYKHMFFFGLKQLCFFWVVRLVLYKFYLSDLRKRQ